MLSHKLVVYLQKDIANHRLGAFIYGFLGGLGLMLIVWGLNSIVLMHSVNLMINIGLTLFGVALFSGGCCREAYLRGNLSRPSGIYLRTPHSLPETPNLISEQIVEKPEVES